MGWYEATNAVTATSDESYHELGTTMKSVRSILQFSKYFTGRLGRCENSLKKGSLKVHTLKTFSATLCAAKLFYIFSRRASRGAA